MQIRYQNQIQLSKATIEVKDSRTQADVRDICPIRVVHESLKVSCIGSTIDEYQHEIRNWSLELISRFISGPDTNR